MPPSAVDCQTFQPSQSFKFRGISLFAQHCKDTYGPSAHLVVASAGNAGLAAAAAARLLGLKCSVYLPVAVSEDVRRLLERENAHVVIAGEYYLEALREAEKAVKLDKNALVIAKALLAV